MKKVTIIFLVVVFFAGVAFLAKSRNILAADGEAGSTIENKLDKILQTQETILAKLAAMSEQLDIIRVRASRK